MPSSTVRGTPRWRLEPRERKGRVSPGDLLDLLAASWPCAHPSPRRAGRSWWSPEPAGRMKAGDAVHASFTPLEISRIDSRRGVSWRRRFQIMLRLAAGIPILLRVSEVSGLVCLDTMQLADGRPFPVTISMRLKRLCGARRPLRRCMYHSYLHSVASWLRVTLLQSASCSRVGDADCSRQRHRTRETEQYFCHVHIYECWRKKKASGGS